MTEGEIYSIQELETEFGSKRYVAMLEVENKKEAQKLRLGKCQMIQK